jgi:hypothetical protein
LAAALAGAASVLANMTVTKTTARISSASVPTNPFPNVSD